MNEAAVAAADDDHDKENDDLLRGLSEIFAVIVDMKMALLEIENSSSYDRKCYGRGQK